MRTTEERANWVVTVTRGTKTDETYTDNARHDIETDGDTAEGQVAQAQQWLVDRHGDNWENMYEVVGANTRLVYQGTELVGVRTSDGELTITSRVA